MSDTFNDSQHVFCLPKSMTMSTIGAMKRAFLDTAPGSRRVIDVGQVETIDLTGIQLLIAMLDRETDGGVPHVSALSDTVAQAFQRAGVPIPQTS